MTDRPLKVYDVITHYTVGQTHSVVAEDMATAERLFWSKYPSTRILEIVLHSEYVITEEPNNETK